MFLTLLVRGLQYAIYVYRMLRENITLGFFTFAVVQVWSKSYQLSFFLDMGNALYFEVSIVFINADVILYKYIYISYMVSIQRTVTIMHYYAYSA